VVSRYAGMRCDAWLFSWLLLAYASSLPIAVMVVPVPDLAMQQ
jgi:hypothetical protein